MQDTQRLDIVAIEIQARALRAAAARDMVRSLMARLRGVRAPSGVHGAAASAA